MKRMSLVVGLVLANFVAQGPVFGQGGSGGLAGGLGAPGELGGPAGLSMPGGLGGGLGGGSGAGVPAAAGGGPLNSNGWAINNAEAVSERFLKLSSRFNHNGVELQSKNGTGFVIATPRGQRILVLPTSLTQPIEISQGAEEGGGAKLTVDCSMLLVGQSRPQSQTDVFSLDLNFADIFSNGNGTSDLRSAAEGRIYQALSERDEVALKQMPLSSAIKYFSQRYNIPILLDARTVNSEGLTDEPITLELPEVSFRSALNLMLDPLELTYVVRNEVMMITTKAAAAGMGSETASDETASNQGVLQFYFYPSGGEMGGGMGMGSGGLGMGSGGPGMGGGMMGGMGMGMGGTGLSFGRSNLRRYSTLQEVPRNRPNATSSEQKFSDHAAIAGPLATQVSDKLGVSFLCIPGDFPAFAIPAKVAASSQKWIEVEGQWVEHQEGVELNPSVLDGSPVVNENGEAIAVLIGKKLVYFPELFDAFVKIDTKALGYWGDEPIKKDDSKQEDLGAESRSTSELPELISASIQAQLESAAKLQGAQKTKAMKSIRTQLESQIYERKLKALTKMDALRKKLSELEQLAKDMTRKDTAQANKLLPEGFALPLIPSDDEIDQNDPFK
jgi:hypothetical protein